jgi:hypothetical protein
VAVRLEIVGVDAETLFRKLHDSAQLHTARYGQIVFIFNSPRVRIPEGSPAFLGGHRQTDQYR